MRGGLHLAVWFPLMDNAVLAKVRLEAIQQKALRSRADSSERNNNY